MKRILMVVLALGLMAPVANAQYIDCGPGGADCTEWKYGGANPPGPLGWDLPNTRVRVTVLAFGSQNRIACLNEGGQTQNFEPLSFKSLMTIREQNNCVVSEGNRCQVEIPDRPRESGDFNNAKIITPIGTLGIVGAHGSAISSYQGSLGFRQLNGRCVDGAGDTVLTQCTTDADCDTTIREECDTTRGVCVWYRQAEDPSEPDFDPEKVGGTQTDVITKCWNNGQCGGGETCQSTCMNSGANCQSDADCGAGDQCSTRIKIDGIGKCVPDADVANHNGIGTGLCILDDSDPGNPVQQCAAGETCMDGWNIFQDGCVCCVSDTGTICPNLIGIPDNSELECPRASVQPFRRNVPDFVFKGGAGTDFGHEAKITPGAQEGNCFGNRQRGCGFLGDEAAGQVFGKCTSGVATCSISGETCTIINSDGTDDCPAGAGICTSPCLLGDPVNPPLPSPCDDVAFGGIEGDRCDYAINGYIDFAAPNVLPDGSHNPIQCKGNPVTIRMTPDENCVIASDTGNNDANAVTIPGCQHINSGLEALPDFDCNEVDDRLQGRCHPVGRGPDGDINFQCTQDSDCDDPAGPGGDGICVTSDVCPFLTEDPDNTFRDSNGDGIGDECQCGDFGDRSVIPIQNDGFVTNIDIAGAAQCANGVFQPDPIIQTIQQCDPTYLDADADFSVTSLDIAGIASVVRGTIATTDLQCLGNLIPQPIP